MGPAPGWYPDPQDPSQARFWDGARWTDRRVTPGGDKPLPKTWLVVGLGVLLIVALGFGLTALLSTQEPPAIIPSPGETSPAATTPSPAGDASGTQTPSADVGSCHGGNGAFTRYAHESFFAAGVAYAHPVEWEFSFDPSYFTWLDDHSALGAIRLDGADNQAGIVFGSVPKRGGFQDQRSAAIGSIECLVDSLGEDGDVMAEPVTVGRVTLGGMETLHSSTSLVNLDGAAPLRMDVYVVDGGAGDAWAELITFSREGSSAGAIIGEAVASVRPA